MAIDYEGATTGLFPRWRKLFAFIDAIDLAKATTITAALEATLATYGTTLQTIVEADRPNALVKRTTSWRAETSLANGIRDLVRSELLFQVGRDVPAAAVSLASATAELLRQTMADSKTVRENIVSATVTPPAVADGATLIVTDTGVDGRKLELMYAETLVGTATGTQLRLVGKDAQRTLTAFDWPLGSSTNKSIQITTPAGGLLANGSFDTDAVQANNPDAWAVFVGTIGTDVSLTATEVQTVTIAGTPTSGFYTLQWTNTDGDVQLTAPLAHNASGSDVQSALGALDGLTGVTVTTAGTSPDFTHTINFNDVSPAGNQPILVAAESFDVGSVTPAETVAGSAHSQTHRALKWLGNGVKLHDIRQQLTLAALTCYGFKMLIKTDNAAATGIIKVSLVDGSGTVINDDAGTANTLTIDVATVSDSAFDVKTAFFRMPAVVPDVVYMRIHATTAVSAHGVYLDDCVLDQSQPLYTNGPLASCFEGKRAIRSDDRWTVAIANDYAGKMQTSIGRLLEIQLRSATSGAETIAEY